MFLADHYIVTRFNEKRFPKQKAFWKAVADARLLVTLLFLLPSLHLLAQGQWRWVLLMSFSSAFAIAFGYLLKALILRPRPNNFVTYLGKFDSSFPSLHSLCAFNLAYLLTLFLPSFALIWFLIAALIGCARMYIQVHYFSDVLGGVIFGIGIAHLTLLIF